jgi:hypothetical protein
VRTPLLGELNCESFALPAVITRGPERNCF